MGEDRVWQVAISHIRAGSESSMSASVYYRAAWNADAV